MPLYSRHPRFTITLLVLVFLSVLLFANSESSHDSLLSAMAFRQNTDLVETLREEEFLYNKMLHLRQELIKKWGPTPEQVVPFPPRDDFYTLWDFFLPSFRCPHRLERIGIMGDGGKWFCGAERIASKKKCVMYSFGINGESSFEADLMKAAPGCEVYGYDYSVNSFGPEIEEDPELKSRAHFWAYALGSKDYYNTADNIKTYKLRTLMERNGHDFIDVLKIDIEGHEFDSLEVFIDSFHGEPLPFGQLQLEVHAYEDSEWGVDFAKFLKWWEKLEEAGLRPFFSEANLVFVNLVRGVCPCLIEYSFINTRGNHEFISNRPSTPPRLSQ
jgi:hypothetical protein